MAIRMEVKFLNLKKTQKNLLLNYNNFCYSNIYFSFEKILYEPNGYLNMQ